MTLPTNLVCAALNYQRLDARAIENLRQADISNEKSGLVSFKDDLGFEVDSIAIIKKCNAILIIIAYSDDLSQEYVRGGILKTWDKFAKNGVTRFKRNVRFYENSDTLRFIAECAIGVHSVTTGDSQVLSQMTDGFRSSLDSEKNPFGFIADWINTIAEECRLKTEIFKGNTSLERIGSEYVVERIAKGKTVLLLGYGKSGKLVAKILNKENNLPVLIVNRTTVYPKAEDLKETAIYSSPDSFTAPKNIGAVVVAIKNSEETDVLISNLLNKLPTIDVYVDLSTPSLLSGKVKEFIGIDALSEVAQKTIGARKDAVSKAGKVIENHMGMIRDRINAHNASMYVQEQKNLKFSLGSEKIDLIKLRGEMFQHLRKSLQQGHFLEVITPFIVGISTDPPKVDKGGTIDVDWINGARAFLRQSNQIYKQICVASGIERIYEIGPFWRKETSESYRHLQESIGLDVELQKPEGAEELYELACTLIKETNEHIVSTFGLKNHLNIPAIKDIPVFTYHEAVDVLRENGYPVTRGDDFGLVSEAKLGQLVKKKYDYDILVIKDYPDTIKKFYTKQKPSGLTETFDVIVDGWELVSGAMRQTDGELIRKSMQLSDINAADYEFYISMVDGAEEHGGFCLGLDRLLAKILDKEMVSDAVPFPRTYRKLIP